MAKQVHININGVWKRATDVWRKSSGIWVNNVMPFVKVGGVYKDCMNYITPVVNWILATGQWNDTQNWDDTQNWKDN